MNQLDKVNGIGETGETARIKINATIDTVNTMNNVAVVRTDSVLGNRISLNELDQVVPLNVFPDRAIIIDGNSVAFDVVRLADTNEFYQSKMILLA